MTVTELQQCTDSIDERKLIDYRYAYVRMNQDEDEARLDLKNLVPPATNSDNSSLLLQTPNARGKSKSKSSYALILIT